LFEPRRVQPSTALVVLAEQAASIPIPDGLEYRIVGARRLKHHEAVDDPARVDSMFDTARPRHDEGWGAAGLDSPGMVGWFISALPFGAEQRDRIAVTALLVFSGRN
jgi:hypothetical protein